MKRSILVLASLLLLAARAPAAEDDYTPAMLKRLGLSEAQITDLAAIMDEGRPEIQEAQAEVNVQKALLSRLLISQNPDMREVERVLRAAAAQEVTIRLVQIRRELAVRKLIGDKRWAQLRDLARQRTEAARQAQAAQAAAAQAAARSQAQGQPAGRQGGKEPSKEERVRSLLQELMQLLGEGG